jgi:hypothetical protein
MPITIGTSIFEETNESENRTRYANGAVAGTSPETLSISQSAIANLKQRRATNIVLRKLVPAPSGSLTVTDEEIVLQFKMLTIPGNINAAKSTAFESLFTYLSKMVSSDAFKTKLLNGQHDIDITIE